MRRCILFVGVLVIVAGCQSGSSSSHVGADSTSAAMPVTERTNSDHSAAAQGDALPVLALDPEGLRLVDPSSGSSRILSYGMAEADVIAAVARMLGDPDEKGLNSECGEGPLTFANWDDGLRLHATNGRFSGWGVHPFSPGSDRYTTVAGIGIGSSRAELEEAYDIRTGESSLGTEFAAGGLHGVLSGPGTRAEITNLWSGTNCIFR